MTKHDLLLALQKFPDTAELTLRLGDLAVPLDHVEMAVDATPQVVEAKNDGDSWQALLANRLKLTLVGIDPTVPKPLTAAQRREVIGMQNALAPTEKV